MVDKENTFSFLISSSKHKRETKKGTGKLTKLTKSQKNQQKWEVTVFLQNRELCKPHVADDHKMQFFLD